MKKITALFTIMLLTSCGKKSDSIPPSSDFSTQQKEAAIATANNNPYCMSLTDFYWEIGDKSGIIISGTTKGNTISGTSSLPIASASKFIWGIYALQKKNGSLSPAEIKQLNMTSGYTSFGNFNCVPNSIDTVQKCYDEGNNSVYTAANDNKFYYNGGHFQKMAIDMGLGPLNKAQLASEVINTLGGGISLTYPSPQLAGGITTTGLEYGKILRKVLNQDLLMFQFLGASAVCTDCAESEYTPMTGELEYSLGHWVEKSNDGAFSSAGLFGFYPWIDQSKTYYGIISRYEVPSVGNDIGSGYASLLCGSEIRKAFFSGQSR